MVRASLWLSVSVKVLQQLDRLFKVCLLVSSDRNESIRDNFQRLLATHVFLRQQVNRNLQRPQTVYK